VAGPIALHVDRTRRGAPFWSSDDTQAASSEPRAEARSLEALDLAASPLPVSVIVPAYQRSGVVGRAIASARAQSRPPAEIVVVDDGSRDDTAEVASRLGARVVRHGRNLGTATARNSATEAATQPWLALLDSDDEWLPHHLATAWALRSDHVLVATSALRWDEARMRHRVHGPPGRSPLVLRSPSPLVFPGNFLPASAVMVRRDIVLRAGGFRPPDAVEDFDLWLRVLEHGTGISSPTVTVVYHVHDSQSSSDAASMQARHLFVASRCAGRPWWSPALVERWNATATWNNVRSSVRRRETREAARHIAWIAARPRRIAAVAQGSLFRARLRRRTRAVLAAGVGPAPAARPTDLDPPAQGANRS
jgi:glycosyltransferase involved in cell wall biosynthesis